MSTENTLQSFEISTPTLDDARTIRRMHAQSWIDTYPNDDAGVSLEWVKNRLSTWEDEEHLEKTRELIASALEHADLELYRIAWDQDKVIGMMHASKKDESQELNAIYVDKAYHGKGVAQTLMNEAMNWLDTKADVELWVADYNQRAIRFYEKYGFKIIPGTRKLHHEMIPIIQMLRKGKK